MEENILIWHNTHYVSIKNVIETHFVNEQAYFFFLQPTAPEVGTKGNGSASPLVAWQTCWAFGFTTFKEQLLPVFLAIVAMLSLHAGIPFCHHFLLLHIHHFNDI